MLIHPIKRDRYYAEGRKIYKNLQMKLPSKIKYTNICKDVFPVFCIFTFVNTYFCRFLQSLKMVWRVTSNFSFFRYIYLCSSLYIFVIWRKIGAFLSQNWVVKKCWHYFFPLVPKSKSVPRGTLLSFQALFMSLLRKKYII